MVLGQKQLVSFRIRKQIFGTQKLVRIYPGGRKADICGQAIAFSMPVAKIKVGHFPVPFIWLGQMLPKTEIIRKRQQRYARASLTTGGWASPLFAGFQHDAVSRLTALQSLERIINLAHREMLHLGRNIVARSEFQHIGNGGRATHRGA